MIIIQALKREREERKREEASLVAHDHRLKCSFCTRGRSRLSILPFRSLLSAYSIPGASSPDPGMTMILYRIRFLSARVCRKKRRKKEGAGEVDGGLAPRMPRDSKRRETKSRHAVNESFSFALFKIALLMANYSPFLNFSAAQVRRY